MDLKGFPRGISINLSLFVVPFLNLFSDELSSRALVKSLLHSAKAAVLKSFGSSKTRLLETELYLEWLNELDYVVSALYVST